MTETLVMSTPPAGPASPASTADSPGNPAGAADRAAPPRRLRRVALDSAYALSAFPLALLALVPVVAGLAAGAGTLVVAGVGLMVLVGTAYVARGFAHVERQRLVWTGRYDAVRPTYLRRAPADSAVRGALTPLRDVQSWLDILWCVVGLVTATLAFAVAVTWYAAALGGLSYWYWERFVPRDPDGTTLASLAGFGEGRSADVLLQTGIGVAALLTLPLAVRAAAATHAAVSHALLCSRARMVGRLVRVERSRDAARVAEAASLRRLERDIHDGPQQRLVRLTMDLGRAKVQLADDPARAGAAIDDALRQARDAVDELRSLSRGIAPPLLVDRGLAAAVTEMAAGCPVPVETSVDVPGSLPPHVETAAYFVVAEALTNVAKHSGARAAEVVVAARGGALEIVVADDGVGGAHAGKGLGLAGLGQRVAAAYGDLEVDSPAGGPTVVRARIPIGAEA
ncbi:sensor histidine kinase [Nocardioides sp. SYSU DS0651]|uniref:sensor histidine kinase n=1 Tax=Nocardioides sp. SYSU DS0651 TaxID=3415955 RepID=UPI003F4C86A1